MFVIRDLMVMVAKSRCEKTFEGFQHLSCAFPLAKARRCTMYLFDCDKSGAELKKIKKGFP